MMVLIRTDKNNDPLANSDVKKVLPGFEPGPTEGSDGSQNPTS